MNFNNFAFSFYVTFKILVLTIGFGHIFILLQFFQNRQASLPSLSFVMFQFMSISNVFFNVFMLTRVNDIFPRLQNSERAMYNMMRSKALMFKISRCA